MKKLMFLTMLFGLTIVITDSVSAQNTCSKKSNGKQVNVEFANATGKPFTINPVDQKCKELPSNKQIPPSEIFYGTSYNGYVFRVREVGTNKLLQEIVIDPSKPIMIIQTDLDDSNVRVVYLDREDDAASKQGNNDAAVKQTVPSTSDTTQTTSSENSSSSNGNNKICSKKLSEKPVNIKWISKLGKPLFIYWINLNCEKEYLSLIYPDGGVYEGISYPGYVYHLVEEWGGEEDQKKREYKTITVSASNGSMIFKH